MAKNKQSLMGLELVSQDSGFEVGPNSLVPSRADSAHLADQQKMGNVLDLRLGAIKSTGIATRLGLDEMAKTAQHAAVTLAETEDALSQLKQQAEGEDYEDYIGEFNHNVSKVLGHQLLQSVKLVGAAIAFEMVQSPYPPPPPPPPEPEWEPTALGRMFIRKKPNW